MSNSKQSSQQKRNEECMLSELNSVLSVRAEQIRKRLLNERQQGSCSAVVEEDVEPIHMDQVESISRPPLANPAIAPISQARLRRQKAKAISKVASQTVNQVSGTKSVSEGHSKQIKGVSTVDIRNYRPGYTWSRGGRVKELRIRCLARKYVLLWYKKTFGRVPLTVAILHYNTSLMQTYFYIWHNHWWEIAKEWRLGVRAECHYRFKVGLQIFINWRKFVILRRESKTKCKTASKHYDHIILRKTWKEWTKYICLKHNQSVLKKRADHFWHRCILRNIWTMWKQKHDIMMHREENHSMAMEFWACRVQTQYWLLWKHALERRRHQQERYSDAGVYHNSILASRCLKAWTLYISNRKVKKAHYDFGSRVYCANLKLHFFNHWYQRWHLLCSLHQHQKKIDTLSLTFRNRWVLWRWKSYVTICKEMRHREALADHHYNCQLQRFGLDSFHLNVVHLHIKIMRSQLAQQLREKQLHRWAWLTWTSSLERKEEARLEPKTERAREHYNTKIMHKCFLALMDYVQWRRLHKYTAEQFSLHATFKSNSLLSQYAQAEAHYYLHIMPKCLFHMKLFVELEKTCRENAAKAKEFRELTALRRTFHFWSKASDHNKDERMIHRMAILHRESVIIQSTFTLWRERTQAMLTETDQISQAKKHYMSSVRLRTWHAWRNFIMLKKTSSLNVIKANCHHSVKKLKIHFMLWRKWVQKRKVTRAQFNKAETHHKVKILRACIHQWKIWTLQRRQFKAIADVKYQVHTAHLLRLTFTEWHTVVKCLAARRREKAAAINYYNRSFMARVIHEWHNYAVVRSYSRVQAAELVNHSVNHLQQLKLLMYFKKWKERKKAAVEISQKLEMADKHYHKCIERKAVEAWTVYWRVCLRKKLLVRQCQWFHDVRVSAKYFLIWEGRLAEHREEGKKSQLALWHWSLQLQQKVLLAWKSYVEIRKHKKSRMINATEIYRQRLLREACCQWLATADSLSQIRAVSAARHQSKTAFDRFQLMQRCTLHWKTWARKRTATRGPQMKKDITFSLISATRLHKNTSILPAASQVYPSWSQPVGQVEDVARVKPQLSVSSPLRLFHHGSAEDYIRAPKQRPPPKRPSFLVDSLKRAGLYSSVHECTNGSFNQDNTLPPRQTASNQDVQSTVSMMNDPFSVVKQDMNTIKHLHLSTSSMEPSEVSARLTMMNSNVQISTPFLFSSKVPHTNMTLEALQEKKGEETDTLSRFGERDPSGGKMNKSNMLTVATQVRRNDARDRWMEHDKSQMMPSYSSLEANHWQHQQDKDTYIPLPDEPLILLKPEDFMKKPVCDKNIKHNSVIQPSSIEAGCGDMNIVKHFQYTFDNNCTDQDRLPVVEKKSRHTLSSSSSSFSKENVISLSNDSKNASHHQVTLNEACYNVNSDYNGSVGPLSPHRSEETANLVSSQALKSEEEIIHIRDKLQLFAHQKHKLRTLRKQYRQLSEWLQVAPDDEDTENIKKELEMMKLEATELQTVVNSQRPLCERLVTRAHTLAQELQKPLA